MYDSLLCLYVLKPLSQSYCRSLETANHMFSNFPPTAASLNRWQIKCKRFVCVCLLWACWVGIARFTYRQKFLHLIFLGSHFNLVSMVTANGFYVLLLVRIFSPPSPYILWTRYQHNVIFCFVNLLPSCSRVSDTHHGIMRPTRVHLLRLTRKPTVGSVTASQARPTNRMIEA